MTIFERAEVQSVNDMAGGKKRKEEDLGQKKVYINKEKWDAPSTSDTTKNKTRKTIRKERGNSGKPN